MMKKQNWWNQYPEVVPSPADGLYKLPGPGGMVPGSGMGFGPDVLSGAPRLGQASAGGIDPSYLAGAPMLGQFPGSSPVQAPPIGYPQPLAGDQNGALSDPKLAVQQAAAAIRDGADPRAVRARLSQVGTDNAGFDTSDLFADLVPGGPQGSGAMGPSGPAQPALFPGAQPTFGRDPLWGRDDLDGGVGGVGDSDAPVPDSATAIQHAADAIRNGADPNLVHARLIQMGQGYAEPLSPFSNLTPKGGPARMGDSFPPAQAQPLFVDQSGFARPATGSTFALDPLGRLPPRLDPRLAPQKSDSLQKAPLQMAAAASPDQTTLSTYGLPSFPTRESGVVSQSSRGNSPPSAGDAGSTTLFTYGLPSFPFPKDERGVAPRPVSGRSATRPDPYSEANLSIGPNERFRRDILAAAHFYHLAPHIIAGLAGAETNPNQWDPAAFNRSSGAAGLLQFLPGTWTSLGERRGSYLNGVAARLGYLDGQGHLIPTRTAQFLALRNDPTISIWAAADYASHNLGVLRNQHYIRNESPAALARYAYIAHHEGVVGAQRFLRGDPAANERKFYSNVPRAEQARYLAANNNDRSRAYLDFYTHYVDGRVDVTRYMRNRAGITAPPTRSLLQ